ncbi:MAG TPA: hypothetical protein VNE38_11585 [Ktedonobacteraceae bacterium]|nr:hypothetical protein [Ktedonobacteraceae bacterium]
MLCPVCRTFRPANNGPCPQCNAPAPVAGVQNGNNFTLTSTGTWGGPITPTAGDEWNHAVSPTSTQAYDNSLWAQVMVPQAQSNGSGPLMPEPGSNLPVPYAPGQPPVPHPYLMTPGFPTLTIQNGGTGGALLPANYSGDGPIYVPPMYTNPRAIIPRYRIISGLISFIVVIGLLCAGGIYYAKATGKLSFLGQIINPHYQNIAPTPPSLLPTPTISMKPGPASNIINSATTASSIDPTFRLPKIATNVFHVGDTIYVTYSVHSTTAGTVTFKWYTNGLDYYNSKPLAIPLVKNGVNGNTSETYVKPTEGKVEIYWNNQLAVQLFFVVEPNANSTPG